MHDFLLSCGHHLIDRDADVAAGVDVLVDENAHTYWERSDQFEMALDLTAGRNGLAKLGEVITLWIGHMLGIDVEIEPLNAMHDVSFNWYLGLDAAGSRIGDALWHGHDLDEQSRSSVVGLYQLNFKDPDVVDLGSWP